MKKNYINGEWLSSDEVVQNINPSDLSDCIDEYAKASAKDAENAIAAAKAAFPSWANIGIQQRADFLDAIGNKILERKEEIGTLLAREEGKTLPEGIGETMRAAYIFKYYAGEVLRQKGELLNSVRPSVEVAVTRSPIGVVGLITPWNFPIAIPAWKIAPALAYGNCVVFKPAELVPGCAHVIAEIIAECGVPAGVFNLVMGTGREVGEVIVNSHDVNGVSFTGSVGVGKEIAKKVTGRLAKVQLEMGGKNPLIILDDADLEVAVDCAVQGAFFSTGQRCTASSRLIVTEGIHEKFVEATEKRLANTITDNALKAGTHIGPVVDERQLEQDLKYIQIGRDEGANLVCGGERVKRETEGFYLTPALFTETNESMRINKEEIFGPVASVIKVNDYEEALAMANATEFGLSGGICTTSLKYATHYRNNAAVGMAMINLPTAGVDYHVPFGGTKGSSFGSREQGSNAVEFYTTVKTTYIGS